jgi:hypothetical protein
MEALGVVFGRVRVVQVVRMLRRWYAIAASRVVIIAELGVNAFSDTVHSCCTFIGLCVPLLPLFHTCIRR